MVALFYSSGIFVVGTVSHSIAILCTVFRLVYRVWTRHFWWEDVWVTLALIADVVCLTGVWIDHRISPWILAAAFPSVLWPARLSIIFSVIRLADNPVQRQITYIIAAFFACMWTGLLAQKLTMCSLHSCRVDNVFALSQLITDVIADITLIAAPLYLWGDVGLSRNKKILILSAFGASLLIIAVTIPHSIMFIKYHVASNTLIFAHVKAALSLVVCNLLVIVTFIYRICSTETVDLDQSFASHGLFTTLIQLPTSSTIPGTLLSAEEASSKHMTTGQSREATLNVNMLNVEEGISTER